LPRSRTSNSCANGPLHYFILARDLRRARFEDTDRVYYDAKWLAFFVAGLFLLESFLLLLLPPLAAQPVPARR
jgi:hypothetical protein